MIIGLAGYYNINSYSDDCIAYAIKHAFDAEHQGIEWRCKSKTEWIIALKASLG